MGVFVCLFFFRLGAPSCVMVSEGEGPPSEALRRGFVCDGLSVDLCLYWFDCVFYCLIVSLFVCVLGGLTWKFILKWK